MGSDYLTNPLVFLINFIGSAYIFIVLLRFFLQWVRADFYHPLSQFVLKLSNPLLLPLRRFIPAYRGLDMAALVLAWGLQSALLLLVLLIQKGELALGFSLLMAIPKLVEMSINLFFYAIIIQALLSWVDPYGQNPVQAVLYPLTAPVLRPFRRLIGPISGIDLSPMIAILALILLKMLLLPPLYQAVILILS